MPRWPGSSVLYEKEVTVGTKKKGTALHRGFEVKNAHAESQHRDAYWEATREQLKSVQNRADLFTLLGVLAIGALLWFNRDPGDGFSEVARAGIAIALLVICAPLWFVTRRKRRISATRGLICQHCGYAPHDTEISEAVNTRHCQRCDQPLD
jgi:hypothetical protein